MDPTKTVASQCEIIGHGSHAILPAVPSREHVIPGVHAHCLHVERVLPRMRVVRGTVGDYHFGEGEAVEDRAHNIVVLIRDRGKGDALAVVES